MTISSPGLRSGGPGWVGGSANVGAAYGMYFSLGASSADNSIELDNDFVQYPANNLTLHGGLQEKSISRSVPEVGLCPQVRVAVHT